MTNSQRELSTGPLAALATNKKDDHGTKKLARRPVRSCSNNAIDQRQGREKFPQSGEFLENKFRSGRAGFRPAKRSRASSAERGGADVSLHPAINSRQYC
ncbi:hypothetical protein RPC_1338 [Rhodopseudomonas palustris BisB18]|uniref:Uncharacterized protein n=1 Tax=Rhodopseudomonas palustris (strain BisB18) TaxID=316056 RepID=Q219N6_RHOPB